MDAVCSRRKETGRCCQISNLKSQISNLKSQISNLKSQISNVKCQMSNLRPGFLAFIIEQRRSHICKLITQYHQTSIQPSLDRFDRYF